MTLSDQTFAATDEAVFSDSGLPRIEARTFELKIVKRSHSDTVYLADDDSSARPAPGKIVLLRRENQPVMAFRILKVYPERRQLAAKRVRHYGGNVRLEEGETYSALERLSDMKDVPTPALDQRELDDFEDELELETGEIWSDPPVTNVTQPKKKEVVDETPPEDMVAVDYDPELDSESSPPPSGGIDDDFDDDDSDGPAYGIAAEETALFEPHRHLISVGGGWNFNMPWRADSVYNAGGVRYSYALKRMMWLRSARLQDAFSYEFAFFAYKPIFNQGSYTVMPVTGSFRYDIQTVKSFTFYLYLGLAWNFVSPGPDADVDTGNNLEGLRSAGGFGMLFPFGPNWNFRLNAGSDSVDLGLALRF